MQNPIFYALGLLLWYWERIKKRALGAYCQQRYRKKIDCGDGVNFIGFSKVYGCNRIKIGDNVTIAEGAFIKGEGGLTLGKNIHISRNLTLYTHNHNYKGEALPYDNTFIYKEVTIEDSVWIGINVTILPGSRIGEGAIIGAGTVVSGDVPPMAIIGSAKNRILAYRDEEHFQDLLSKNKFGGLNGIPIKTNKPSDEPAD